MLLKVPKTVTTYDFSSLYTSLSHEEILDSLRKLIKEVFGNRSKKSKPSKLSLYQSRKEDEILSSSRWVFKPRPGTFHFTENTLIESIKFQLDSTYFKFGGNIFKHVLSR